MHYSTLTSFLCCLLLAPLAHAQGVRGTVKSGDGKPLEFTTIFVPETGSGTSANTDGFYEIRLPAGNYTLVFQHLGYKTSVQKIALGETFKTLDIVLEEQPLELNLVDVSGGQEDIAYTVMRKAIAKASFHRQQVDSYSAQVYIKGSGRLKKVPFLLKKTLEKEGIDDKTAFVSESVSKIEYRRPNYFKETVISVYTRGDDNDIDPNSYLNGSFYEPEIAEVVSPLSPRAFAHYRFELEGFFMDRGYGVNKIRVIPRSRGDNVFEGSIYIVEDEWSIHSLALKAYKMGVGFLVRQTYAPVDNKVWLPVNHKFEVDAKVLGFDFEYNYLATVSDYKVTVNPDLQMDVKVIDENIEKELAAELARRKKESPKAGGIEEKLASGQELTRKDLRRLMRDYEKEERKADKTPEVVVIEEYSIDSLAANRDSLYWEALRPVPLTTFEVRSYLRADSLRQVEAEKEEQEEEVNVVKRKNKKGAFSPWDIVTGSSYKVGKGQQIRYESPFTLARFNPVEGFVLMTNLTYTHRKEGNRFAVQYTPRYSFAREALSGKGNISYGYGAADRRKQTLLEGGRYTYQYYPGGSVSELFNAYQNLVLHRNFISLYEKDFLRIQQDWKIRENWSLSGGAEYAERQALFNNTTQTWFVREDGGYAPNNPPNREALLPIREREKAVVVNLRLEARPWQKYKLYNNKRQPIEDSSPTIVAEYRKGIAGVAGSQVNYDLIDLSFRHTFRTGAAGKWDFKADLGMFLNNASLGFADFKHFRGNRLGFTTSDPVGSFRLMDYYLHSTQDKYAALHLHYRFRKFLFTQIPEVWLLGIKENLFVNYLATPTSQNYVELGYGLDNIFQLLRLEAAVAVQDGRYLRFGVLLGISASIGGISIE